MFLQNKIKDLTGKMKEKIYKNIIKTNFEKISFLSVYLF